jgi:hypothetical protein
VTEISTRGRFGKLEWALTGLGGGAGLAVGIAAIKAIASHPEFLPQLLNGGFLYFAALMSGMVIFKRELRDFNAMQLRNVVAQEELARNVGAMVAKDDQRAREQELTLNHLARRSDQLAQQNEMLAGQNDEILKHLREMRQGQ